MAGRSHPYRRDHADATPDLLSKARSTLLDDTPSGTPQFPLPLTVLQSPTLPLSLSYALLSAP